MFEIRHAVPGCTLEDVISHAADPDRYHDAWQLHWLGQAGFALLHGHLVLLVDPYLSDSLAVKYAGGPFPHVRMMPLPADPQNLHRVAYVLCTHAHSDHMDPGSLPALAAASPRCTFIVPRPALGTARERGVPAAQLMGIHAGETIELGEGVTLTAVPAAHDKLQPDADGHHPCLGYVLSDGRVRIYHSGDSVDFAGLADQLAEREVDLALLPVNGRREELMRHGIIGNFTFEEAVDLCRRAGISALVPHHFGMFAENTIDEAELEREIAAVKAAPVCVKPMVGQCLEVEERRDA